MEIAQLLQQGVAHQNAGRLAEAEKCYQQAMNLYPRDSNAYHLLGVVCRDRGEVEQAIRLMTTALTLSPAEGVYYNSLATCYLAKKEHAAAESLSRRSLALKPDYADALTNLGLALRELARLDESEIALKAALQIAPGHLLARCHLGNLYGKQKRMAESLACYEQVVSAAPNFAEGVKGKSEALFNLSRYEEAIVLADRAAELDAKLIPEVMQVKGQALGILGRLDEACAAFDRGLKASPGAIELAFMRAKTKKVTKDDPFFSYIQLYEQNIETVGGMHRARVGYALGKTYEDVGNFESASKFYAIGAQGVKETKELNEQGLDFIFETMKKLCSADYLASLSGQDEGSDCPIFILGMPRSGTTLTEQIIATHPLVIAGDELDFAHQVLDKYRFPGNYQLDHQLRDLPADTTLPERGRMYLEMLNALRTNPAARHVTDKMPGNYSLLGLIAMMLPKAKIIHCRRDPVDTCISCYTQLFTSGHEWTYDLAATGRYFRRYWGLMEHWRKVLPGRFLEVRYEELVNDTEAGARKLLDWCGLDWDEQVLRFYETVRPVRTASVIQVRQPIYTSSMGRWKKWEPYIQPLLAEIGDLETAYWAELERPGAKV